MKVPFNDLYAQHNELRPQITQAIHRTIDTSSFIGGQAVSQFEDNFAAYCGAKFAVGVSSGTEALRLALQALDIGQGDAVITVPNTFMATVEAVVLVGATPVFVDIDPTTYTMEPELLRSYLQSSCSLDQESGRPVDKSTGDIIAAIMPVHLYGFPADMDPILDLASEYRLAVVEDACQAHGAVYFSTRNGLTPRKAGTLGNIGCFSFYPGKNLGAMGDAGAVITEDAQLAEKIRLLRNHGQITKYDHVLSRGSNCRLDSLQAAILDVKLQKLDEWNSRRRRIAAEYSERLERSGITLPRVSSYGEHVYHLFVVQIEDRDQIQQQLAMNGIETGLHYPIPLHLQRGLRNLGLGPGMYPETEEMAKKLLSLPMHPHMDMSQIGYVCDTLLKEVR